MVKFGYIFDHQRKLTINFILLQNLLAVDSLDPDFHTNSYDNQVYIRQKLKPQEGISHNILLRVVKNLGYCFCVAELKHIEEFLALVLKFHLLGICTTTFTNNLIDPWFHKRTGSLQHVYVVDYNGDGQDGHCNATVLEKLKVSGDTTSIVLEIFDDVSTEPVGNFHFLKSAAARAFEAFYIVLPWTDTFHVYFGQLQVRGPFDRIVLVYLLHSKWWN